MTGEQALEGQRQGGRDETRGMWTHAGPYVLDWPVLGRGLAALAEQVRESGFEPTVTYAVANGGMIPAWYLTSMLSVGRLRSVRVRRTVGEGSYLAKQPPVMNRLDNDEPGSGDRVLVVDDIVGTSATIRLVLKHLGARGVTEIRVAALVRNHLATFIPDYCAFVADDWVIFPWEKDWLDRPKGWRPVPESQVGQKAAMPKEGQ